MKGVGSGVWGLGFLGVGVKTSEFRVYDLEFRVWGSGLRA
jgi:hypothetical protein